MNIHEWCIAVLKGRVNYTKTSDLYSLCTKHFQERTFNSEDELLAVLEPFKEFFHFEDFRYDYVTFDDDGQKDSIIIELAKDVLRSHSNRYTLSVLCRMMNETANIDIALDDLSLKNILSNRRCFTIEGRSMKIIKLSAKGEECDIEPIVLGRSAKSEEEKKKEAEQKIERKKLREQEKQAKEQERLLRKAIKEEERERKRKLKQKKAEHKEDYRVEKVKTLIAYYHITDETALKQLWIDKLIRKVEYIRCADWRLYTVGQVYAWVESHNLPERMEDFRKHTVQRLLKIASFHDPELARLIPHIKFSGIQKANRGIKLSKPKREAVLDPINIQFGDVLRWNYTNEEGVVIGFDNEEGTDYIIVRSSNGTKMLFENDPKLFRILEGDEKENVKIKWEKYIAESKN